MAAPPQVEHAPTVPQCQADRALWMSQLESDHGTDDVTVLTLQDWEHENAKLSIHRLLISIATLGEKG